MPDKTDKGGSKLKVIKAGNLDPNKAVAVVNNPDGSMSTVRSASFNFGEGEVLIPTVHPDGYIMTNEQAVQRYKETGLNFGTFATPEDATSYANALHNAHDKKFNSKK